MKRIITVFSVFIICTAIFTLSGYLFLDHSSKVSSATDRTLTNIPYSSAPSNSAVIVSFKEKTILFMLDFSHNKLLALTQADEHEYYLEKEPFYMALDEYTLSRFINRIGGIETMQNGVKTRLTGIQTVKLLNNNSQNKTEILSCVLDTVSKTGLTLHDLVFLIENSDTDLTVPDCFDWPERLKGLFQNCEIK